MPHTAIIWLRRDLRLADQPAFGTAANLAEQVLPLYIHAPAEERPLPGAASRWWLHHSLAALRQELLDNGSELFFAAGASAATLLHWAQSHSSRLVLGTTIAEPWAERRDREVAEVLAQAGIELRLISDGLLTDPHAIRNRAGKPYQAFTPYWRQVRPQLLPPRPQPAPSLPPPPNPVTPADCPSLDDLGLLPPIRWDHKLAEHWQPGSRAASTQLSQLTADFFAAYPQCRDIPAQNGTTRLSPHLHCGELSIRALWHAAVDSQNQHPDGAATFLAELGWREFAYHLLAQQPDLHAQPVVGRFAHMPWREDPDGSLLSAWQRAQTGIPLVDAGMRQLWATGWMHNRVRMVVGSLLVKNLRLPWQRGEEFFRDTLVDWDLAANSMGWQWVAGCGADAAPYFRIFNPVRQGARFDPQGEYIRRWLPQLSALSNQHIHQPWMAPAAAVASAGLTLGKDYPRPVIDLQHSRKEALAAFHSLKR